MVSSNFRYVEDQMFNLMNHFFVNVTVKTPFFVKKIQKSKFRLNVNLLFQLTTNKNDCKVVQNL